MNKIKCEKCRSVIAESTCERFAIDGLIKCEACGMTYRHLHSEKIFDRTSDCAAELTTLRARVKELEEKLAVSDLAVDLAEPFEMDLQSRIRELEESMPDVSCIRDTIKFLRLEGYGSIASPLESMASRIEAVMRKGEG